MKAVPFRVLREDEQRAPNTTRRRNWEPLIETLATGLHVFVADANLKPNGVKYLQLAFLRRRKQGEGLYLRSSHVDGGYELWTERTPLND
jgi:hypothetical protein